MGLPWDTKAILPSAYSVICNIRDKNPQGKCHDGCPLNVYNTGFFEYEHKQVLNVRTVNGRNRDQHPIPDKAFHNEVYMQLSGLT